MTHVTLDELNSSTDGSTDTENTSDSDDGVFNADELEVLEAIGADIESAREYVEENGSKDDLLDFARNLDDDLMALQEEYRQFNGVHRIVLNHLRSLDADFTAFTGEFYGNSDDPEPGTYNDVQQRSRDADGNLAWYKALFPEPQTDYWDGAAVLWQERPDDDTHIYVTEEFATEYADFARDIDGKERPLPPSNEQLGAMDGNEGAPLNPSDFTVEELRDELHESDYTVDEMDAMLEAEKEQENRKTARKAIKGARNQKDLASDSDSDVKQQVLDAVEQADDDDELVEALGEALS